MKTKTATCFYQYGLSSKVIPTSLNVQVDIKTTVVHFTVGTVVLVIDVG